MHINNVIFSKWKGYDDSYNLWIGRKNFNKNSIGLIKSYEKRQRSELDHPAILFSRNNPYFKQIFRTSSTQQRWELTSQDREEIESSTSCSGASSSVASYAHQRASSAFGPWSLRHWRQCWWHQGHEVRRDVEGCDQVDQESRRAVREISVETHQVLRNADQVVGINNPDG